MQSLKRILFYLIAISGFATMSYWIVQRGKTMESGRNISSDNLSGSTWGEFINTLQHNLTHPLALLLLQIIVIILTARLFGWFFKKVGQPTVIGEIIAGITLGPSFLGHYFPNIAEALLPLESLNNLQFLSQIGLIFFMFIIGMQLDLQVIQRRAHDAIMISHASIIIPFVLGVSLAYFLYTRLAPATVSFTSFALFIGISMSITAFPVLARIVQERDLHKTKLGSLVITCAAVDDVTAWCLLAIVITIVKAGNLGGVVFIIAMAIAYVFFMIKLVRPFLHRVADMYASRETLSKPIVAIFFINLLLSAYITEVIGIHALFGAFMAGAIMPNNSKFKNILTEKMEDVALLLLLPLFFVYTGLRTEIGTLHDRYLWQVTVAVILVAIVGKFIGSSVAAKLLKQNWKDSLTIGALMNTRGLMELVVLNIGYDLGVLTPEIFTMMVIMALVTTCMTGPGLDLIDKLFKPKNNNIPNEVIRVGKYNILIAFGHPERSVSLLRLAHELTKKMNRSTSITAVHLSPTNDMNRLNAAQYEQDSFSPLREEAQRQELQINSIFKASNNLESEIVELAHEGDYDLLLIGVGQSIFDGSALGKIFGFTTRIINPEKIIYRVMEKENPLEASIFSDSTQQILYRSRITVGVFFDKGFKQADHILLFIFTKHDLKLIRYAQKFIHNSNAQVIIIDRQKLVSKSTETLEHIRSIEQVAPNHISRLENTDINEALFENQDLILLSTESWKQLFDTKNPWLKFIPSTLLIKDRS